MWLVGLVSRRGVLRLPLSQWLSNLWIGLMLLDSTDEELGGLEMWLWDSSVEGDASTATSPVAVEFLDGRIA
jgi:hypothetical protein